MLDSVDSPEFLRSAAGAVDPPLLLNGRSEIAHHIANLSTSRCKRVLEVVFNEVDRELCSTLGELVERGFTIKKMRFLRRSGNDSLINSCLQTILNSPKGPPSTEIVFCTDKRLTPSSSLVDVFQSVDLATVAKVVVNRKKRITTEPVYDCSGVLRDLMNANALRCLDLRSVEVSDVDASVLIAWAESPTCSLVELLMDNCSLTRCFIIPAIISRNTSLVSLGVSGNFLDDHQLRQLLASLSINGTLKSLDLSYNSLRNLGSQLGQAVRASNLQSLSAVSCRLNKEDFDLFVDSLVMAREDPTECNILSIALNKLDLSENAIVESDLKALISLLSSSRLALRSLSLNHCMSVSHSSNSEFYLFSKAVADSSSLRNLSLQNCGLYWTHMYLIFGELTRSYCENYSGPPAWASFAVKPFPMFGTLSHLCHVQMRASRHDLSEEEFNELAQLQSSLMNYIRSRLDLEVAVPELALLGATAQVHLLLEMIGNHQFEEACDRLGLGEGISSQESIAAAVRRIYSCCPWQRDPSQPSPVSRLTLECLDISCNGFLGLFGGLALVDFLKNVPCHGLRTINMQKCNIGNPTNPIGQLLIPVLALDKRLINIYWDGGEVESSNKDALIEMNDGLILSSMPWPLNHKVTLILCVDRAIVPTGLRMPVELYKIIFSFLRLPVRRKISFINVDTISQPSSYG